MQFTCLLVAAIFYLSACLPPESSPPDSSPLATPQTVVSIEGNTSLINGSLTYEGRRLLVGTSFNGRAIPTHEVAEVSDFILIHGNGVSDPTYITQMVDSTKALPGYQGQPIAFNEDDPYAYDVEDYHLKRAIESYASWGYFDVRRKDESDISIGFQNVPVDWQINSPRIIAFFEKLKEITQP